MRQMPAHSRPSIHGWGAREEAVAAPWGKYNGGLGQGCGFERCLGGEVGGICGRLDVADMGATSISGSNLCPWGVVKHGFSSCSHLCHVKGDGWCQLKRRDSGAREFDSNPDSDI